MGSSLKKTYMIEQINASMAGYIAARRRAGKFTFAFKGGRRSGKTICICQFLILRAYNHGEVVNVASMTEDQGRNGVYADMLRIIDDCPTLSAFAECTASPMVIRFRSGGKIIFKSYKNSETAKGIACDWLYENECNNFTEQQDTDLRANVRKGTFYDWNPCGDFWIHKTHSEEDIHTSKWTDNPFLTDAQRQYFADLKANFESPKASALDIYNYNRYYLGLDSELRGQIFMEEALTFCDPEEVPKNLCNVRVFGDPSAMVGSDWFPIVLSAKCKSTGKIYILDVFTTNDAGREAIVKQLYEWIGSYDRVKVWIETNGYIGEEFFKYAKNSRIPVQSWYSSRNKFERICAAYEGIRDKFVFVRSPRLDGYMAQVYEFSNKCAHDDNVDALASTYYLHQYT